MPARSKVIQLPEEIRAELDARLVRTGFSGYADLEAWLAEKGYQIGKSSLHRYGEQLEAKLAAIKDSTAAAAAIAEAAPDDADLRSAAVISLVQTEIFDMMIKLREADEETNPVRRMKILSAVAGNIAKLSRASVAQKKWEVEVRDRVRAAADAAERVARRSGLSDAAVTEIRQHILGIPG